jgi:hypothetical protein
MLSEVSRRIAREGDTLCSFRMIEKGFNVNEMRRQRATKRRRDRIKDLVEPNLFRTLINWKRVAIKAAARRRRTSQIGRMGSIINSRRLIKISAW